MTEALLFVLIVILAVTACGALHLLDENEALRDENRALRGRIRELERPVA